jgi:nitrite reductase/ring-hydroxylating ferredoxin subunit
MLGHFSGESTVQSVCRLEDIKIESGKEVSIDAADKTFWVMLFNRQGVVLGFFNQCPHQGRALNLASDRFLFDKKNQLVCPHHGACFDLQSGMCVSGPCEGNALKPVKVSVIEGEVFVDLPR